MFDLGLIPTLIFLILLILIPSIKIIKEYERAVIFRLGRLLAPPKGPKGPGLIFVIPFIDKFVRVNLRLVAMDVPPQDIITRDNVSVKVNAVVYFRVIEPNKAITEVDDYLYATSQLAQTTLRSILGNSELDDLLSNREHINNELQEVLDARTDAWGIKVSAVEVKHVDLPQEMQRAMAKQAEAERERRAKVIGAEGEFQAASKIVEAAKLMEKHPVALQLRYLQTLREVATENNSTTLFPIPIDFLEAFMNKK
ncbi:MAG TPA: slipin family protein [Spirochaetota bacterium]|jgi:regulator of protease activity HflC (stomatin/prohibitin superfamily)|nr:slipin family protein [Spirochaetota bacterium]OQA99898.1 MAG: Modulator of FtsH protease HflK [Spirochaetes bacterium ADurb.Bin218]HOK02170.1 slipin family protein [Spirochaetota bacterium]HOK92655.1 slipin family protein [Spirochaetota bacterium]HON15346.1 slipin family protein [Spirochaetota bacterium]